MHTARATDDLPDTLPALVSNGVVGLRVPANPLTGGWCTVSGHVGRPTPRDTQGWVRAPYPLAVDLRVNGQPQPVQFIEQCYDFQAGELTTRLRIAGVAVTVLTFASRTNPHVVAQRLTLRAAEPVQVTLATRIEPGEGDLQFEDTGDYGRRMCDAAQRVAAPGGLSQLGVAVISRQADSSSICDGGRYSLALTPERETVIEQVAALVPQVAHAEPDRQAIRLAYHAMEGGFDRLVRQNRAAWAELWLGRPVIDGPADAQRAADAAFFYLHSNVHPAMPANTGLFGLGLWPSYHMFRGHAFWDVETFALPGLNLTDPAAARRVLMLRHEHLDAARRNARMNGYDGAMYPWESGTLGEEVTGIGWPKVFVEHHVSLDIAIAMIRHVNVTGDAVFAREVAWPVVRDVATWLCSRVEKTPRGYEIRDVTGIDEGRPHVDNNAWTNGSAIAALDGATRLAQMLGEAPPPQWARVARAIYLPIEEGVLLKYDGQPDEPGLCPDPLALVFPLQWPMDADLQRRTLTYFLQRREGYIGYPMLSTPMFVWGARLGDRELAAELFTRGVSDFMFGPFDQIDEFGRNFTEGKKPRVGPYLAHCGALLSSLLLGLPRLNPGPGEPSTWPEPDPVLPDGWRSITVSRLHVRGQPMQLTVEHGRPARLTPADSA